MKDELDILQKNIENMTDIMYQHCEKFEQTETEIRKMRHGFNEVM